MLHAVQLLLCPAFALRKKCILPLVCGLIASVAHFSAYNADQLPFMGALPCRYPVGSGNHNSHAHVQPACSQEPQGARCSV